MEFSVLEQFQHLIQLEKFLEDIPYLYYPIKEFGDIQAVYQYPDFPGFYKISIQSKKYIYAFKEVSMKYHIIDKINQKLKSDQENYRVILDNIQNEFSDYSKENEYLGTKINLEEDYFRFEQRLKGIQDIIQRTKYWENPFTTILPNNSLIECLKSIKYHF